MKHGRIAMDDKDVAALCEMVQGADTYVEIGTLWGGSVIEVTKANQTLRAWCIDLFKGYYGTADSCAGDGEKFPSVKLVKENLEDAGVLDRVTLIQSNSHPFPLPDMAFEAGLVDGCHTPEHVRLDIESLKKQCKKIAVHDVDDGKIMKVVDELLYQDKDWRLIAGTKRLVVFEKVI